MKSVRNCFLVATGLLALIQGTAALAAGTVVQKATSDGTVELTNLDDIDTPQANAPVEKAALPATAPNRSASTASRTPVAGSGKSAKKPANPNDAEESEENAADANTTAQDSNGTEATAQSAASGSSGNSSSTVNGFGTNMGGNMVGGYGGSGSLVGSNGTSANGSTATSGSTASGGSVAGSGSTVNANSGTAGSGTTSSSSTGTNTAGSGSGTTGASTGGTNPASPATDTANVDAALQRYRQLMLQSGATQSANPALTRRYIMVDRATYRGMLGL